MNGQVVMNIVIQGMVTLGALFLVHKPPFTAGERAGIYLIFGGFVVYAAWNNYLVSSADTIGWVFPIILGVIAILIAEFKKYLPFLKK